MLFLDLYKKINLITFLKSKWWSFEKRAHNFRHNYGITERSSIGFHALSMNYFKATLIPEKNNQPHSDSFIEHMTNNYYEKFPEFRQIKDYFDIRGACKFQINEIIELIKKIRKKM